jgi:threonine efflux protein
MDFFLNIFLAGFIYIFTPGPVFLSIFALVSEQGRVKGYQLISGSMIGTSLWLCFTIISFIEADRLPPALFLALAILASSYLFWLGFRMFFRVFSRSDVRVFKKPFVDGLLLGCLNPKSYPVMLSVFSALILQRGHDLTWNDFPAFFLTALSSFIIAEIILVAIAGIKPLSKMFVNHISQVSCVFGIIYIVFGISLLTNTFY